ncbi:MAG: class I SAM-dependent methyltransferase [Phormidesmis sp.]
MKESQAPKVSFTARSMAAARALESRREDALFHDPLAEKLAGAEAIEKAASIVEKNEKEGSPYPQVRTRFLDDVLLANASDIRQVVLLGAGLDTRAFRMGLSSDTHVYEIDQQDIFDYKNPILENDQPSCVRHTIVSDVSEGEWPELLLENGFQKDKPSIWIAEGFLYYLFEKDVIALMKTLQTFAAVGSVFACDVINEVVCNGRDDWSKYWQWGCDEPEAFWGQYGWLANAVQPGEEGACFDRYTFPIPPREDKDKIHIFFVTAVKT